MRVVFAILVITSILFGQFKTDIKKEPSIVMQKVPVVLPELNLVSLDSITVEDSRMALEPDKIVVEVNMIENDKDLKRIADTLEIMLYIQIASIILAILVPLIVSS